MGKLFALTDSGVRLCGLGSPAVVSFGERPDQVHQIQSSWPSQIRDHQENNIGQLDVISMADRPSSSWRNIR